MGEASRIPTVKTGQGLEFKVKSALLLERTDKTENAIKVST